MNRKIIVTIIFGLLVSSAIIVTGQNLSKKNIEGISVSFIETNSPNWQVGNFWTYKINSEGDFGEALEFSWTSDNLKFTVNSDASSCYTMSISGDISGEITLSQIQIIKGTLKDTTVSGTILVDKSNIGFKEIDASMQGKISVAGIPVKSFTLDLDVTISPAFSGLVFPISVGKSWNIPASNVDGTARISLLQNPIYIDDLFGGDSATCMEQISKTVDAGTYDAYKIVSDGDITERYYAEGAGNIIKAFGDTDKYIDVVLKSTNFEGTPSNSPNKPSKPSGPSRGVPETTYDYSSATTDPQGDNVYYWFDWGDGTNSGWVGPYESGQSGASSHEWDRAATFSVKVKAKDTDGHESQWSEPLSVTMPRYKFTSHLLTLLERYPLITKILRQLE